MTSLALPIVVPLGAAAVSVLLGDLPRARRWLSVAALTVVVGVAVLLVAAVVDGTVLVAHVGGWGPALGISLVADPLAAIMVLVSSVVLLVVLIFAIGSPKTDDASGAFHPVYLVL